MNHAYARLFTLGVNTMSATPGCPKIDDHRDGVRAIDHCGLELGCANLFHGIGLPFSVDVCIFCQCASKSLKKGKGFRGECQEHEALFREAFFLEGPPLSSCSGDEPSLEDLLVPHAPKNSLIQKQ
jgi:hypothetical protein